MVPISRVHRGGVSWEGTGRREGGREGRTGLLGVPVQLVSAASLQESRAKERNSAKGQGQDQPFRTVVAFGKSMRVMIGRSSTMRGARRE